MTRHWTWIVVAIVCCVYCASCLAQQLTRRASGAFPLADVQAVVAEVVGHPGPLRVMPREAGQAAQEPATSDEPSPQGLDAASGSSLDDLVCPR